MSMATGTKIRKATLGLALSLAAALGTLGAGVFAVSAISQRQTPARWAMLSDVGDSFGAISAVVNGMASTAMIVTFGP